MDDDLCSGFEQQTYSKDRCKKCFRLRSKHTVGTNITDKPLVKTISQNPTSSANSSDNSASIRHGNGSQNPCGDDDSLSITSFKSVDSALAPLSCAQSNESLTSNEKKGPSCDSFEGRHSQTPTVQLPMIVVKTEMAPKTGRLRAENEQFEENSGQDGQEMDDDSQNDDDETSRLRSKLLLSESFCKQLLAEKTKLGQDVDDLHTEMNELQDQYREEEIDEFRELQRELEQIAKNCRILQFKLRKSERAREQVESDRERLQDQLANALGSSQSVVRKFDGPSESIKTKELQSELRIAKEVSVRLHTELEQTEEKRYKFEDENFYLKEKIRELETRSKLSDTAVRQKRDINTTDEANTNLSQLVRDLQDAVERETDLRDQLKFAEEDIQLKHRKVQDLETENEGLLKQLTKLVSPAGKMTRGGQRPPMLRSASEGQTQIQLELAEHEVSALSAKLNKMERENESLLCKMALLENEVKKTGGRTDFAVDELVGAIPDTYYKQKIKLLEEELDAMKAKLDKLKPSIDGQLAPSSVGAWRFGSKRVRSHPANQSGKNLEQSSDDSDRNQQYTGKLSKKAPSNDNLDKIEQMQKDIYRFTERIAELERDNSDLKAKLLGFEGKNAGNAQSSRTGDEFGELINENRNLANQLREEKRTTGRLTGNVSELKQLLGKSDNQKLVAMASKVEVLSNRLVQSNDRFLSIHNRNKSVNNDDGHYTNSLKERCEKLEQLLSAEKAQKIFSKPTSCTSENSCEELEQCYEFLAIVEAQMDRIQKQLEKINNNQSKDESRRRSFSRENGDQILAEMAKINTELKGLKVNLQDRNSYTDKTMERELLKTKADLNCREKNAEELREKLELVWNSHALVHLLDCAKNRSQSY